MPRLQVFITIENRSYKNRLSLYGFAARHPPHSMADWRKRSGFQGTEVGYWGFIFSMGLRLKTPMFCFNGV
jgi:hypothetical protein